LSEASRNLEDDDQRHVAAKLVNIAQPMDGSQVSARMAKGGNLGAVEELWLNGAS
jgi:hypothetical protein